MRSVVRSSAPKADVFVKLQIGGGFSASVCNVNFTLDIWLAAEFGGSESGGALFVDVYGWQIELKLTEDNGFISFDTKNQRAPNTLLCKKWPMS